MMINLKSPPYIACAMNDRDVLSLEGHLLEQADLIELRIDMFEDIGKEHILEAYKIAKEKFKKPIISTIRELNEGGERDIKDRLRLYEIILPFSEMVDVEINSEILYDLIRLCKDNKKILIGSYHNFELTPEDNILEEIFKKGKDYGVDIIKIAVMPNDKEDIFRLIAFTLRHRNEKIITMAMGKMGLPTRIFNPFIGSMITYGYINRPSAPGQLSIEEISNIFKVLNIRES